MYGADHWKPRKGTLPSAIAAIAAIATIVAIAAIAAISAIFGFLLSERTSGVSPVIFLI